MGEEDGGRCRSAQKSKSETSALPLDVPAGPSGFPPSRLLGGLNLIFQLEERAGSKDRLARHPVPIMLLATPFHSSRRVDNCSNIDGHT
jgi:hypothetical protein